jgi:hypothetical protein
MDNEVFSKFDTIKSSTISHNGTSYTLAKIKNDMRLLILYEKDSNHIDDWDGERVDVGESMLVISPLNSHNASQLRNRLPWLNPKLIGLGPSAGLGDRLGLATPGHVRAVNHFKRMITPIFAQQSMREMARTNRTPQQVMDDAMWGVFQENWQEGFGADADHLKTEKDIEDCFNVGYTFYTIDPGEYVDNRAESADLNILKEISEKLPPEIQATSLDLLNRKFTIENINLFFNEKILFTSVVKYGSAVAHIARLYRHLESLFGNKPFELEVSVDETDLPTSFHDHAYIAIELKQLGVKWFSLAPRFVGRFEKGVDYIGNIDEFSRDVEGHAAIARYFGPYKLSLHSGSDKFSIYPYLAHATQGLVHLKTAGTSYLEALHTVSDLDESLMMEIYQFARDNFEKDRQTYHYSAKVENAIQPSDVKDWNKLINQFDARQILHMTFGSVITAKDTNHQLRFYPRIAQLLRDNADLYAKNLEAHFIKHLTPFADIK